MVESSLVNFSSELGSFSRKFLEVGGDHICVIQSVLRTVRNILSVLWSMGTCVSYVCCCCDKIPKKSKDSLLSMLLKVAVRSRSLHYFGPKSGQSIKILRACGRGSCSLMVTRKQRDTEQAWSTGCPSSALILSGSSVDWIVSPIFRVGLPLSDTPINGLCGSLRCLSVPWSWRPRLIFTTSTQPQVCWMSMEETKPFQGGSRCSTQHQPLLQTWLGKSGLKWDEYCIKCDWVGNFAHGQHQRTLFFLHSTPC